MLLGFVAQRRKMAENPMPLREFPSQMALEGRPEQLMCNYAIQGRLKASRPA